MRKLQINDFDSVYGASRSGEISSLASSFIQSLILNGGANNTPAYFAMQIASIVGESVNQFSTKSGINYNIAGKLAMFTEIFVAKQSH